MSSAGGSVGISAIAARRGQMDLGPASGNDVSVSKAAFASVSEVDMGEDSDGIDNRI